MTNEWTPKGGSFDVSELQNINIYEDLPDVTALSEAEIRAIRTGDLAPDVIAPFGWDGSQFTTWRSLFDGKSLAIPDNTVAHYDASQLSLNDGDTVSVWPDEQGDNDLDIQTGSPTYVESGINGNPAIAFNGDGLEVTGLSVTQPNTTYVVFEYQSGFDGGRVLSGVSERQLVAWADTDLNNWRAYADDYLDGSTASGIQQMTTVFDGGNSIIREDGVEISVGDAGTSDLGGLSVGYDSFRYNNYGTRSYADAYVSEIVLVNSGSVDLDFENQLLEKWGITA